MTLFFQIFHLIADLCKIALWSTVILLFLSVFYPNVISFFRRSYRKARDFCTGRPPSDYPDPDLTRHHQRKSRLFSPTGPDIIDSERRPDHE